MGELSKLPNIGKTVETQLNKVGINSVDDLRKIGAKEAWLKVQEIDESACINRLMALEGAIEGVKKTMLPNGKKHMGRKHHQKKPSKKNYGYIKEKLTSSIHKGITIVKIKGRDKWPLYFITYQLQRNNIFRAIAIINATFLRQYPKQKSSH